jgi:hypothetical protein
MDQYKDGSQGKEQDKGQTKNPCEDAKGCEDKGKVLNEVRVQYKGED